MEERRVNFERRVRAVHAAKVVGDGLLDLVIDWAVGEDLPNRRMTPAQLVTLCLLIQAQFCLLPLSEPGDGQVGVSHVIYEPF